MTSKLLAKGKLSEAGTQASRDLEYNAKTSQDTVAFYDDWANDYESDQAIMDYNVPESIVTFFEELILAKTGENVTKLSSVIDFAAGTGLVGELLRNKEFSGKIDAVDGSKNMLKIAKKKNIYDRIICHTIEPEIEMPVELATGKYDVALVCSAMIRANLIHPECLKHFASSVRSGGLIIFSIRNPVHQNEFDFKIDLEKVSYQLVTQGIWKLEDVKYLKDYKENIAGVDKTVGAFLFCYKKL